MKTKLLLFFLVTSITLVGCSKKNKEETPEEPVAEPAPYIIKERFENGTKGAYAAGDVILTTGSWHFNDALIGSLATDLKDSLKSARIREGNISMNFDIEGLGMLYISHGKFGNDAASTWQLMMSADNGTTYAQVGTDIIENNTSLKTDSFSISAMGKVRFKIQKTGTARINIDNIVFKGTGDPGITIGIPDTDGPDSTSTGNASSPRDVTAGTDAPAQTGENSNMLFGNPSSAQPNILFADNYLIDHKYFVVSYSSTRGTPNWVSWHLDASNITGQTQRLDNFAGWSGLPGGWFQVQSNSYVSSGFDRGHNCPSADRTSSTNANSSTFLMTNMIPQAPNNNQRTWNNLEQYLRTQASSGNEIYIIMGSYGIGGTGSQGAANTIASGRITVPANVWKIALILPTGTNDMSRINTSTRVLAVNTPNTNSVNSDWKQYIVTVRDIEKATGYNLLSDLPQSIQDQIEIKKETIN